MRGADPCVIFLANRQVLQQQPGLVRLAEQKREAEQAVSSQERSTKMITESDARNVVGGCKGTGGHPRSGVVEVRTTLADERGRGGEQYEAEGRDKPASAAARTATTFWPSNHLVHK